MKEIWTGLKPIRGDCEKILIALKRGSPATLKEIQLITGISKTRTLCSLVHLERSKAVTKKGKFYEYDLKKESTQN